ncbi:uroporphyrinogen decarboxylase family protein [Chloroflexota bacterium]
MDQTSKELVRNLFELKSQANVPFMPWVCSFAAQLEQVSIQTMLSDAGILSRALINSQKLFGYDVITSVFDPSIEAEACGCELDWTDDETLPEVVSHPLSEGASIDDIDTSDLETKGRLPAVLEATKRITILKGKDVAVAGLITGPLTLGKHLKGESFLDDLNEGNYDAEDIIETAGSIALKLCRIYCEMGVDLIVIAEEMIGQLSPEMSHAISSPLRSIWNVARFYNVHSLVLSKGCSDGHIEPILDLQADGLAVSGGIDNLHLKDAALARNSCFSRSIPSMDLTGTLSQVGDSAKACISENGKGLFISTEWDVPYSTNVNNMHEVMSIIR